MDPIAGTKMIKVIFVGHSYVGRLEEFITDREHLEDPLGRIAYDFNLYKHDVEIEFIFKGGAKIKQIRDLAAFRAAMGDVKVIVLLCGGNDIDGVCNTITIADEIHDMARDLSAMAEFVVISQIISRENPRHNTKEEFAMRAREINSRLSEKCREEKKLLFWTHIRICNSRTIMASDGVHLNKKGNLLLYCSYKKCLAHIIGHLEAKTGCTCRGVDPARTTRLRAGLRNRRRLDDR